MQQFIAIKNKQIQISSFELDSTILQGEQNIDLYSSNIENKLHISASIGSHNFCLYLSTALWFGWPVIGKSSKLQQQL